jgi:hypothetical protein
MEIGLRPINQISQNPTAAIPILNNLAVTRLDFPGDRVWRPTKIKARLKNFWVRPN